jgi:hypothetical protein
MVIAALIILRGLARNAEKEALGVGAGVMLVLFISTSHSKYPGLPETITHTSAVSKAESSEGISINHTCNQGNLLVSKLWL